MSKVGSAYVGWEPGRRGAIVNRCAWPKFCFYNAYNNLNPFFAQTSVQDDGTPVIREYGIFPIIPSVSWRVTF